VKKYILAIMTLRMFFLDCHDQTINNSNIEKKYRFTGQEAVNHVLETGECRDCYFYDHNFNCTLQNYRKKELRRQLSLNTKPERYEVAIDLSGSKIESCSFNSSSLDDIKFSNCDIEHSYFTNTFVYDKRAKVDFENAVIKNSTFALADLSRGKLNNTVFFNVLLWRTILTGAEMNNTVFVNSNVSSAYVNSSDIVDAKVAYTQQWYIYFRNFLWTFKSENN
jgi:uncharacterized protein YjbI with pentapeptide repeats